MSHDNLHPNADVRMRGFAGRATVASALAWVDEQLAAHWAGRDSLEHIMESVHVAQAGGRVLVSAVESPVDVPPFARAMMDGYALCADDTLGASSYNRLPLRVVGECLAGTETDIEVHPGEAARIMTGAPLPAGADAVLPVEQTESEGEKKVLVQDAVSPGKHVGTPGEDIRRGTTVLPAGRRLRPQDLGVLSSMGLAQLQVLRKPKVRVLITGNELLRAGTPPEGCRITDANGPMLHALVERDGGVVLNPGIVPDDREAIRAALADDVDVVLASGGSSVGQEDHVPTLLAEQGELSIHGIAMRPSSPAGMGKLDGKLVFLLPGNPVSCLCAYDFFAGRLIRSLSGLERSGAGSFVAAEDSGESSPTPLPQPLFPYRTAIAPLKRKLVSVVGRYDYARVRLTEGEVEPVAISGASVLSSTTRADGFVLIPDDSEGYPPGTEVEVHLYDL